MVHSALCQAYDFESHTCSQSACIQTLRMTQDDGRPVAAEGPPGSSAYARCDHLSLLDEGHMLCAAADPLAAIDGHWQFCFQEEAHHKHAHDKVSCTDACGHSLDKGMQTS